MSLSAPYIRLLLVPITGIILLLPGCKKPTYSPKSLSTIAANFEKNKHENGISISATYLNKSQVNGLFDRRGSRLLNKRKPIYPLHISIRNNSTDPILLDPANIGLALTDPHIVAQRLYSHTARRIVTPLILGAIGTAATFVGGLYLIILGAIPAVGLPALVKAGYTTVGLSGLFSLGCPFISYHQGHNAIETNKMIDNDLMQKTLKEPVIIGPHSRYDGLLFVSRKSYVCNFSITVIDQATQKSLVFDMTVSQGDRL